MKPDRLGVIGKDHVKYSLEVIAAGGIDDFSTFKYRKVSGVANNKPFVLEVAFGVFADMDGDEPPIDYRRQLVPVHRRG